MRPSEALNMHRAAIRRIVESHCARNARVFGSVLHGQDTDKSKETQRLPDYLRHILQAIHRIQKYTENITESVFLESEMVQDAVIRNFEIIGEASRNIQQTYPEFVAAHPDLPIIFAYGMRNALMH